MLPVWLRQLALEARVDASLKTDQPVEAIWADLLQLLRQYNSHSVLHRLLFRRGYRPQRPADQVALFEAILAEPEVPECLHAYARISLAYRCIKDDNRCLTAKLIPALKSQVWALISDPEALRCQRPNRRNRLKLLISSLTALNHLQLLGDDHAGLRASSEQICSLLHALDWSLVPADVAYRMLTNTGRCLGLAAIQACCQGAPPQRLFEILALLDAMQREAWADRHRHSAAQENHRRYVAEMRCRVAGLLVATPSPMTFEPGVAVGELALNVRTPALLERLEALLRGSRP